MEKANIELKLMIGVKLLLVLGVGYAVYAILTGIFLPSDSWPPSSDQDEDKIVANYKKKLQIGDSPLSSLNPEDVPVFTARIIDCDVKRGNLQSAREYGMRALNQKQDEKVQSLVKNEDAKQLIDKLRNAIKKRDDLNEVVGKYTQRPALSSGSKADRAKFDSELQARVLLFCQTPFDRAACPEHAAEIEKIYRAQLEPAKKDPRLARAVEEIEKNCLPPK
jgi:hypothetical protein